MSTVPKPFAFILIPFDREFDDVYELAIKPACEDAGAYAERVDKQIFQGSMLDRIYNQISKADALIADMSERNPNVFYEVGYAHALGKTTILLTKKAEDIPFDLKHYPHIIYEGSLTNLKVELAKRLKWHLDNPQKSEMAPEALRVRVNGEYLVNCPTIEIEETKGKTGFDLHVELQNRVDRWLKTIAFKIGLFAPIEFVEASPNLRTQYRKVTLDASQRLFLSNKDFSLLPEMWDSIRFAPVTMVRDLNIGEKFKFCIRLYFDSGCADFPFHVDIKS